MTLKSLVPSGDRIDDWIQLWNTPNTRFIALWYESVCLMFMPKTRSYSPLALDRVFSSRTYMLESTGRGELSEHQAAGSARLD